MSDSRADATNVLDLALSKLRRLEKPYDIFDIKALPESRSGSTSDVYRGKLMRVDGTIEDVAVKRVRLDMKSDKGFKKLFAKEMHVWSTLSHPNIVKFVGYLIEGEDRFPSPVSLWAEGGTIIEYIERNPTCDIIHLVSGVAAGISYLHKKDIIHGDIKGSNVLVDDKGIPMLTDFGLSRAEIYSLINLRTTMYNVPKGTAPFMAYELLEFIGSDGTVEIKCTKATDMWAFGMLVYELISGQAPYANVTGPPLLLSFRIFTMIRNKKLPAVTEGQVNSPEKRFLWDTVCQGCWDCIPEKRITVDQVIDKISYNAVYSSQALSSRETCASPSNSSRAISPTPSSTLVDELTSDFSGIKLSPECILMPLFRRRELNLASPHEYQQWTHDPSHYLPQIQQRNGLLEEDVPLDDMPPGIVIICTHFGSLREAWKITVNGGKQATARTILGAVYASLYLQVSDEGDLAEIDRQWMADATKAYERRRAAYRGMKELRRIDFLADFRWFRGIRKECDNNQQRYLLITECIRAADQ